MSFKYKGVMVTMGNYLELFPSEEPDILDEIRSAILDDTQISGILKFCEGDSYKLGQLRLAIREYLPKDFINPRLSGKCVKYLRELYKRGFDLSVLARYIPPKGAPTIENDNLELILRAVIAGADIRRVDFNIVSNDNINIICEGLVKKYPMWLCISQETKLSNSVIRQLMKGMQLQVDVHPFVSGDWTEGQIILLLSNVSRVNINDLLKFINYRFSVEQIMEIIYVARQHLDFDLLCLTEKDGTPAFNSYQMNELGKCLKDDVLTEEIYNPKISDMEMADLRLEAIEKRKAIEGRKLGGTLGKKH